MLASRVRMATFKDSLSIPGGYVLATDDDFSGTTDGDFRYIGTGEYVIIPDVIKGVAVTSYYAMFFQYAGLQLKGVGSYNKNVTIMKHMFQESKATALDLSSLDTSNVISMVLMFAYSAATVLDVSNFNTSNVTHMNHMFKNSVATELDLSSFDTSKVTRMDDMFYGSRATTLDLSNFDTSSVTDMSWMFQDSSATTLDLSSFDISSLTLYGIYNIFKGCAATTGYARTQADADRFNASWAKPTGLTFVVKS